jgi:hypothetical protein
MKLENVRTEWLSRDKLLHTRALEAREDRVRRLAVSEGDTTRRPA